MTTATHPTSHNTQLSHQARLAPPTLASSPTPHATSQRPTAHAAQRVPIFHASITISFACVACGAPIHAELPGPQPGGDAFAHLLLGCEACDALYDLVSDTLILLILPRALPAGGSVGDASQEGR